MARNLVNLEKAEEKAEIKAEEKEQSKIIVMTTEQVILNNVDCLIKQLAELNDKVTEGFKQVGVKFEEKKE